jgi:Ca2+/Na+ antiporter
MDELDDPWRDQLDEVSDTFGAPEVQALFAFVLAVVSMAGFSLLNGTTYFFTELNAVESYKTRSVLAALLGAAFALIPVVVGWRASARTLATDARWIATLARTAVLLGLLSLGLRLVLAVVVASGHDPRSIGRF